MWWPSSQLPTTVTDVVTRLRSWRLMNIWSTLSCNSTPVLELASPWFQDVPLITSSKSWSIHIDVCLQAPLQRHRWRNCASVYVWQGMFLDHRLSWGATSYPSNERCFCRRAIDSIMNASVGLWVLTLSLKSSGEVILLVRLVFAMSLVHAVQAQVLFLVMFECFTCI